MYKKAKEAAPDRPQISKTIKNMPIDICVCVVFDLNNVKPSTVYNTISRLKKESKQTISYTTSYSASKNQLRVWRLK